MKIENLRTAQEKALNCYKIAKIEFTKTITKENPRGDFEKWKAFCCAKADCMKLGCRV